MEAILDNDQTIASLVDDILDHYKNYRAALLTGKAMIVAYSRSIAMKIYKRILQLRPDWTEKVGVVMTQGNNDPEEWREIIGYRDVLNTIRENYEYIPFRPTYILQLHQDLYRYSEKGIGGKFKNTQNYISATDNQGNTFVLFTPLPPYETPAAIERICDIDTQEIDPLILIPVLIHDFFCIHSFNDGNGRMSRLLTTLLLYRNGYYVGKYISLESKIAQNKDLYYDALEASQHGWMEGADNPTPFIKYLLLVILSAYRDFNERTELVSGKRSALEIVRQAVESKLGKFTKSDMIELCPTLGKTSVERSIKKLVDEGDLVKRGKGSATFYARV